MRCLLCESFSLTQHICTKCQRAFLAPSLYSRKLKNGTEVFSFYLYDEIKPLLFTKHTDLGYYIFQILAKNSFAPFAKKFESDVELVSLAVDDNPHASYSHTAILNHALHSKNIKPLYNRLHATNSVKYSGKSKVFREAHPRGFTLKEFHQKDGVILVDDIITTGTTLTEASNLLKQNGKEVLFCLTLCDVQLNKWC